MEYIEGSDLANLIENSRTVPVLQACDPIRQAATGPHNGHEREMIHRDIKPDNLMPG
jgi:serine/threonine-protein kinase